MKRIKFNFRWLLVLAFALSAMMLFFSCGNGGGGGDDDDTDDDAGDDDDNLPPECTDEDGDNYSPDGGDCGPIDCDDNDPNTHPKADELCDGKDNNCDGNVESECWQIFDVDNSGKSGRVSSIWFDPNDNPAVAYIDGETDQLKLAYFDGQDWNIEVIESEKPANFPSLKIGPDGTYYIAYSRKEGLIIKNPVVYLAYGQPSKGWTKERVKGSDIATMTKDYPSLVLSPQGEPIVFFYDSAMTGGHGLICAKKSGGSWSYTEVDSEAYVSYYEDGARTYAAVAPDGTIGVAWQDTETYTDPYGNYYYFYSLKYAQSSDLTNWTVELVHSFGEVPDAITGGWCALAFLPSTNAPIISFMYGSGAPTDPGMAVKEGGVWNAYALNLGFGIGEWPAIAAVGNHAYFVYFKIDDVDLVLCDFDMDQGSGECEIIDTEGNSGKWPNIALNSLNDPAISYYDLTNTGLKVAWYRRFSK